MPPQDPSVLIVDPIGVGVGIGTGTGKGDDEEDATIAGQVPKAG